MKKKVLFIIGVLDSGGVAKSLVNLLNVIDPVRYDIGLLVMSEKSGPFEKYLPENVHIVRNTTIAYLLNGFSGLKRLLNDGQILLAIGSVVRMMLTKFSKSYAGWMLAKLFPAIDGDWDTIVEYNGQQDLYYMVDKLNAKKKITFFHSDYKKWPYYERMDRRYFLKVDAICTISEQCVQSLKEVFPEVAEKVKLVPNISLPSMIHKLAEEQVEMPPLHGVVLVTVGHVCFNKGIDLIIGASKNLIKKGVDFSWILVGSIHDADNYVSEIRNSKLKDYIYFVGIQSNPYAFMKRADIIVHPSRFEGKSITLDEAKILCKPIVVTNFSTVHDQFEDGVNAVIVEQKGKDLADAIVHLIQNKELQKKYIDYLRCHPVDDNYNVDNYENIL